MRAGASSHYGCFSMLVCEFALQCDRKQLEGESAQIFNTSRVPSYVIVGSSSQANHLMRNAAMDDSIGGS